MNKPSDDHLLQRLVPADDRGCEPCPPLVNSLIPADEQAGSPAPVESPQPVEALVAVLEAAIRDIEKVRDALYAINEPTYLTCNNLMATLNYRIAKRRSNTATGGNGRLNGGGEAQ